MKYEQGDFNFKGLNFCWSVITTEKDEHGEHEVFNFNITYKDKTIRQEFHNSIMELEITQKYNLHKKSYISFAQVLNLIRPKMWAGYDENLNGSKTKTEKEFIQKRIYWLLLSFLTDFGEYVGYNFSENNPNFEEFCSNYGYDYDSIKAERIYKNCLDYERKIRSLNLTEEQKTYFSEIVRQEEESFIKELKTEIQNKFNY